MLLIFSFCAERDRTNQFDVTRKGFAAPPCCYTWGQPVYDPHSGYLIAVQIGIEFTDPMPRTLSFDHKFICNGTDVLDFDYSVDAGANNYGIEISYGGQPFPLGDYCLKIYWGEFGYGAFVFSIVPEGGVAKFKGITRGDAANMPKDWYFINLAQ